MLIVASSTKFVRTALVYNLVVMGVALLVYSVINFRKHYEVQGQEGRATTPFLTRAYHAVMTHVAGGGNDVTPRTTIGRVLLASHSLASWLQVMFVFLEASS